MNRTPRRQQHIKRTERMRDDSGIQERLFLLYGKVSKVPLLRQSFKWMGNTRRSFKLVIPSNGIDAIRLGGFTTKHSFRTHCFESA
jgi:hypothetical protein